MIWLATTGTCSAIASVSCTDRPFAIEGRQNTSAEQ